MNTHSQCQRDLQAAGNPYPRTCAICGLGPCKAHLPLHLVVPITPPDPLTSAIERMLSVPSAELIGCYNAADNNLDWIEAIRARLIEAAKG